MMRSLSFESPTIPVVQHTSQQTAEIICFDSPKLDQSATESDFTLTRSKEGNSDCNDDKIPQAPKVRCIEEGSSIPEFAEFITRECSNPYIE